MNLKSCIAGRQRPFRLLALSALLQTNIVIADEQNLLSLARPGRKVDAAGKRDKLQPGKRDNDPGAGQAEPRCNQG